ncbi:PIN domain-containing protein [Bradyrhizobium sp. USDA 3650]
MVTAPRIGLLLDTCVWLDIAGDHRNRHLIHTMESLNGISLYFLVPRLVLEEFTRNKERLVKESAQSLSSALRRTRDTTERFGSRRRKATVLNEIDELERSLTNFGDQIAELVTRGRAAIAWIEHSRNHGAAETSRRGAGIRKKGALP